jgi:HK97 family phage major capsid protein
MSQKKKIKEFPGGNGIRFMPVDSVTRLAARAEGDDGAKRFEVAFSSEKEVLRRGFFGDWREVLGHDPSEVDMGRFESGRAAFLEEHRGVPIGVIESARLDKDRMGRASVRTSQTSRGQDAATDIEDEVRTNISVGYIPKRAKLIEENEEKGDLWRVTSWEPVELSLVGVPADETVGVGRSLRDGYPPVETEGVEPPKEERKMGKKWVIGDDGKKREVEATDPRPAVEAPEQRTAVEVLDRDEERQKVRAEEQERIETIRALCKLNGVESDTADKFVRECTSVKDATSEILKLRETGQGTPVAAPGDPLDGLSGRDRKRWSFTRALRLGAGMFSRDHGDESDADFRKVKFDGIEAEVHRKLERDLPVGMERRGGILIPIDMRTDLEREEAFFRRTLQSNVATKGAETIFTGQGEFIELFRSAAMVTRAGARTLTGLTGPLGFVKQTGGVTVFWVGENPAADVADSDMAFGFVTMAQKTLQGSTGYTRQALLQSSLELDLMSRQEFVEAHARAIDKAAIYGKGAAGEPWGIYTSPGVNVIAFGGTVAFGKLIDMATEVALDNAFQGRLAYITSPKAAGKAMQTLVAAAAGSDMIWTGPFDNGVMANYPAFSTTQVSDVMLGSEETGGTNTGLIFGNWAEVIFGLFGTMELVVDPYTKKKKGVIEVTSFQMADLILRHGESFCKATGLVP